MCADIFYHGAKGNQHRKTPHEESRAETLRYEMMIIENERMQKLIISRPELVKELDRIEAQVTRVVAESMLEMGTKKELMAVWFLTRKKALSSRTDLKTLLRMARAMGPEPETGNGTH
jgi:hypothetical protein